LVATLDVSVRSPKATLVLIKRFPGNGNFSILRSYVSQPKNLRLVDFRYRLVTVQIDIDWFTALRLGENCMRQAFFHDQPESEPMPNLGQQVRDNDRLACAGHSKQDAVLRSVSKPAPDPDRGQPLVLYRTDNEVSSHRAEKLCQPGNRRDKDTGLPWSYFPPKPQPQQTGWWRPTAGPGGVAAVYKYMLQQGKEPTPEAIAEFLKGIPFYEGPVEVAVPMMLANLHSRGELDRIRADVKGM
jgi:hypothetical protein